MAARGAGAQVKNAGTAMLRYGLVVILLMIGATKWTPAEAEAIRPWVADSPLLSWIYAVTIKDFFLLGAAVWSAGEAIEASTAGSVKT